MPRSICTGIKLVASLAAITAFPVRAQSFTAPPPGCVQPPNTTMVAWFPFDELAGTSSLDLAAGNNGFQVNGPLGTSGGKVGGAASFNGTNQFIETTPSSATNFGPARSPDFCNGNDSTCQGNFSIDTWVQVNPFSGVMTLLDKRDLSRGYSFFLYSFSGNTVMGLQLADGSFTNYGSPILSNLTDGDWHHLAVTVNRSLSDGIHWYYNGGEVLPRSNPTAHQGPLLNGRPLLIGAAGDGAPPYFFFKGKLDELEIYNRELTVAEVNGIFLADSAGKCKPPASGALASCVPSSSMGLLVQKPNVTAYVPKGSWSLGSTGIQVVPIEPGGKPASIGTPDVTNSCASNSVTGQTVCVANGTSAGADVYLITGATLDTTLKSGADVQAGFSGGGCYNCGVAIDAAHNSAVIEIGLSGAPSGSGLQVLDLTGQSSYCTPFCSPSALNYSVSENIQVDPFRNIYLSASENNEKIGTLIYDLLTNSTPGTSNVLTEYTEMLSPDFDGAGLLDSSAEDCTTGIALSSIEAQRRLLITDLTQAIYSGGTWSAPWTTTNFPEFKSMYHGTDGIAVAPGRQLAIVTGEGGGNTVGVVVLPGTSGFGTPSFGDYVAANLPNTPDNQPFDTGSDPHTVSAFISPNNGRPYGVVGGWKLHYGNEGPTYLAIIDLQKVINAPRCTSNCTLGPHEVDPTYDLLTNNVVRYVSVF